MSITVELADLPSTTATYGWAYLLTVRDDLRPHVVAVAPAWAGGVLVVEVGSGTAHNATARPAVTLCYPPIDGDGYSLVVDGTARVRDDGTLAISPTGAVLHRPAPPGVTSGV
jgi:hypothetical protein